MLKDEEGFGNAKPFLIFALLNQTNMNKKDLKDLAEINRIATDLANVAFSIGTDIETILPILTTLAERKLDERIDTVHVSVFVNDELKGKLPVKVGAPLNEVKEKAMELAGITDNKGYKYYPLSEINFSI